MGSNTLIEEIEGFMSEAERDEARHLFFGEDDGKEELPEAGNPQAVLAKHLGAAIHKELQDMDRDRLGRAILKHYRKLRNAADDAKGDHKTRIEKALDRMHDLVAYLISPAKKDPVKDDELRTILAQAMWALQMKESDDKGFKDLISKWGSGGFATAGPKDRPESTETPEPSEELTEALPDGTVKTFLMVFRSLLTQYDQQQMRRETKRGGMGNIYRLGHLLKAFNSVDGDASRMKILGRDDEQAMRMFKEVVCKHFICEPTIEKPSFPPVKKLFKQIDNWTGKGKKPTLKGGYRESEEHDDEQQIAEAKQELVEDHLILVVRTRKGMDWLRQLLKPGFQVYSAAGATLESSKYKGTPIDNIISDGDASAVIISPTK